MLEFEFFALLASLIGLFIWNRSESRSDIRNMDNKLEIYVQSIREDIKCIQEEMKDFHTRLAVQDLEFKMRLCAIEEKRIQKQ